MYRYRSYLLDYYIPRKNKLALQVYIGYLVGYDSTNIYQVWIPSRDKVICIQDVTMNDDLFYNLSDLDIGDILREEADRLIKTLDLPETQEPEFEVYKDDLLDILDSSNQFE